MHKHFSASEAYTLVTFRECLQEARKGNQSYPHTDADMCLNDNVPELAQDTGVEKTGSRVNILNEKNLPLRVRAFSFTHLK